MPPSQHQPRFHMCGLPARRAVGAAVVAVVLVVAACSGDDGAAPAAEPEGGPLGVPSEEELAEIAEEAASVATIAVPDDFQVPDTRAVALPVLEPAPDATEPARSVPISGGDSTLVVDVVGPDGRPVPGATVLVERFADGGVGTREVGSNEAGRAGLSNILGGRYRVRAWLAPRLAATSSEVTFLRADSQEVLRVQLEEFEGFSMEANLTASEWAVGQSATFQVVVAEQAVAGDGIVRGAPVNAEVQISLSAGVQIAGGGDAVASTGNGGVATWTLTCARPGAHQVTVSAVDETLTVPLPPCVDDPDAEPDDEEDDDDDDDEDEEDDE